MKRFNTREEHDQYMKKVMEERTQYLRKHPVPETNGRLVGKPTKWDKKSPTTKKK